MDDDTVVMERTTARADNPFAVSKPLVTNAAAQTSESAAVGEVQAKLVIAKRFPRDQIVAVDNILNAFSRPTLAEKAEYAYSRGGSDITGPSIRAAETIAQLWGNMDFGLRELSQDAGFSTVEAFAWDMQTNTRRSVTFQVRHWRDTKKGGYKLEDGRDIYELVANMGQRRVRACILGVLPGDVVESAMNQAAVTLKAKAEVTPERLKSLLEKFAEFGIPQSAIEKRIQRRIDAMTPGLMLGLGKIYNSLKDGMSVPSEWFELDAAQESTQQPAAQPTRGAAGLKAGAAKAAGAKAAAPSYAELAEQINTATTQDSIDLARSLIGSITDEAQRTELSKLAEDRAQELKLG